MATIKKEAKVAGRTVVTLVESFDQVKAGDLVTLADGRTAELTEPVPGKTNRWRIRLTDRKPVVMDEAALERMLMASTSSAGADETTCADCGCKLNGRGTMRTDASGLRGLVCPRCNQLSLGELSFA